jgi:hypothetical protein
MMFSPLVRLPGGRSHSLHRLVFRPEKIPRKGAVAARDQVGNALSPTKEEKTLDLEFLPKDVVDKVEDKLGLKKGSPKVNELKKSLIQAGIYHEQAPSIYFGLKFGLTVAVPVLAIPFIVGRGLPGLAAG